MERPHTTLNRPWPRLVGSLVTAIVLAMGALPAAGAAQALDMEFGVGGVLRTNFGGTYDWAYGVALQPDGKIVAARVSDVSGSRDFALPRYHRDFALARYHPEGSTAAAARASCSAPTTWCSSATPNAASSTGASAGRDG